MNTTVYSLPDCQKCDKLKEWMWTNDIEFETKWFDTEAQTEFIMRNMFGNPPILTCGDRVESSEALFNGETLKEELVKEVLSSG